MFFYYSQPILKENKWALDLACQTILIDRSSTTIGLLMAEIHLSLAAFQNRNVD